VEWNFQKYLVARDGAVAARFTPRTAPGDPALVARLEELLDAAKPRP
jgi:glutathione peroxidase